MPLVTQLSLPSGLQTRHLPDKPRICIIPLSTWQVNRQNSLTFKFAVHAEHRRRSDFESGGALSLRRKAPENFFTVPPLLPRALLHGWARAS